MREIAIFEMSVYKYHPKYHLRLILQCQSLYQMIVQVCTIRESVDSLCRDGADAQNTNWRCAEHEKLPNSLSRKF